MRHASDQVLMGFVVTEPAKNAVHFYLVLELWGIMRVNINELKSLARILLVFSACRAVP
jgi:hypothetical protein